MRFDARLLLSFAAVACTASSVAADGGTCARKRMPPNQNLLWVCVTPGAACTKGACQTVHYSGIVNYSTCECLSPVADPNDFSYGTGGLWTATVASGVPGPGASVAFVLAAGVNALIVYPNVDVDLGTGAITNAQVFTGNSDLTGGFTLEFGAGAPMDSLPVTVSALSMTMTSWSFEGEATGVTTLTLAADGGDATGVWHGPSGTLLFDEPIHCTASNTLLGDFDYYFRPILLEGGESKSGVRTATNPFSLVATGRLQPAETVPVRRHEWGGVKNLFR